VRPQYRPLYVRAAPPVAPVILSAPEIVEVDDETGLRVWDCHPDLVVHQGVEVGVTRVHLGLLQRHGGFVGEILDAEGTGGPGS